jgi:hypothetical protein
MWADCYFVAITIAQQQSSNGCSVLAKEILKRKHKSECQKQLHYHTRSPVHLPSTIIMGHKLYLDHGSLQILQNFKITYQMYTGTMKNL